MGDKSVDLSKIDRWKHPLYWVQIYTLAAIWFLGSVYLMHLSITVGGVRDIISTLFVFVGGGMFLLALHIWGLEMVYPEVFE